jgi:hypothetical protein
LTFASVVVLPLTAGFVWQGPIASLIHLLLGGGGNKAKAAAARGSGISNVSQRCRL